MGQRGPLPLTAQERRLRGERAAPRTLADVGAPSEPVMPRGLDPEARREWRRVTRLLRERGVLDQADRSLLVLYCRTWSRWLAVDRELGETYVQRGSKSTIVSPLLRAYRDLAQLLKDLAGGLGISPAARLRLPAPPQPEEVDDLELLLLRKRGDRRGA